jgi:hypothetical protein
MYVGSTARMIMMDDCQLFVHSYNRALDSLGDDLANILFY